MSSYIKTGVSALFMFILLCGSPTTAAADWLFTPYLGVTFGGNADFGDVGDLEDNFERKVTYGGTLTWMGAGIIGLEADLGITPNFFENTSGDANFDFGEGNVTTLMGNLVIGAPVGGTTGPGFRPYGSAGLGLLRSQIDASDFFDELSKSDLGVNIGGGAHVFFGDNVGLRGDLRYFRSLQDEDVDDDDPFDLDLSEFDFWRATVGVTFRFGG
jgi:opacity protein-like surface antigen